MPKPALIPTRASSPKNNLECGVKILTRQIIDEAKRLGGDDEDLLMRVAGKNGAIDPVELGKWLRGITGRIVCGMQLVRTDPDTQRSRWMLVRV